MLASTEQKLPVVFGRYLLFRRLSRGGMGEIFLARSGQLAGFEKLCVIKKVLPALAADQEFISRFIDEAQVAIQLSHANIASVFEVGMVDGEYFLALEYVEGRDLRRIIAELHGRAEKLPLDLALWIVREIASGLAYAHRKNDEDGQPLNVVHCDVSPPNIVISFEGDVKIIDFGIAKSAVRLSQTNPAVGFGKFGYMAPEQLVRGGVVDRRTDLYATGVILYELLTGERLFQFPEGTDYRTIARAVANGQHPLPSQREATLAAFDSVVARALAPDPKNRYPTAEELRDAVQTELARVNPRLTADRLGAFVRQHFEEELTEERSLIREMRAVDLSAYAEELHDAQVHTVSFARGDSQVSKEVGPLAESSDAARTDRTPLPPPTVLTEEAEVATSPTPRPILASQDSSYSHELEPFPRRPSWIIFAVIAAGCLIAGGVLAMTLLRKEPSPGEAQAQVAPLPAEPPRIVVQPMAEEAPAAPAAAVPKMRIEPDTPTPAAVKTDRGHRRARGHREKGKESATGIVDPFTAEVAQAPQAPKADAEAVKRRFLTVKQEYEAFRKQYGGRLDSDYNEILELQTFGGEGKWEKLDAKLAALRKKMADARKSE